MAELGMRWTEDSVRKLVGVQVPLDPLFNKGV